MSRFRARRIGGLIGGVDVFQWLIAFVIPIVTLVGHAIGAVPPEDQAEAERSIAAAAQAESRGDVSHAHALLNSAVRSAPANRLAHWLLGEIQTDNQWRTVEEAQQLAASDPRQIAFQSLRKLCDRQPSGDLGLADWCRRNNMNDEARYYWAKVLSVDPKNKDALQAFDLRWDRGYLVPSQSPPVKDQQRDAKLALEKWKAKVARWRRAVSGRDETARSVALADIRGIRDAGAIPALETVTIGRELKDPSRARECRKIGLASMDSLSQMPVQAATESLVRHAVLARTEDMREYAMKQLKLRDPYDYVPVLLEGLAMPIELTVSFQTDGKGNSHYQHSLYREGKDKDWAEDANYFTKQHWLLAHDYVFRPATGKWEDRVTYSAEEIIAANEARKRSLIKYNQAATALESSVASQNKATEDLNSRIIPVLSATTGEHYGSPTQWWGWWDKQNEYYSSDHPVDYRYNSGTDNQYYPRDSVRRNPSCFVRGTPIWTKTGLRPVESLEVGELVLSQDVNTGELKYEPVIGRTVRPPSEILKLTADGEEIRATRGHPFWVAGVGWRMAKELSEGANLHGLKPACVRSIVSDGKDEAYNLVVAEFSTYFVGQHGFLVHDNSLRGPTRAIVPGVVSAK